jgi:hypothetical protein
MDGRIPLCAMLHCPHNEPMKSFGRDYINWNVEFPCPLSYIAKNHGHDVIDAGFRSVLLTMGRKAWVMGLVNSIGTRTASKVMISSVVSHVDCASIELALRLAAKFSASPELCEPIEMKMNPGGAMEVLFPTEGFERFLNAWIMNQVG